MKKYISVIVCCIMLFVSTIPVFAENETPLLQVSQDYDWTRFADDNITLNVYNWGEYIADGSEDSIDVIAEFEKLTGIKVAYLNYDTNETLYAKMSSGGTDFDVIFPSDYMIGKMVKEGMLAPLDYDNIPNAKKIDPKYKGQSYDPNDTYSVPYTWGVVGIIYNKTMVDEPVDSWDIMWDKKYQNQILMFNNSRDAFAIAAKKLGLSLNPQTIEEVEQTAQELKNQKSVVQAYVMDEIFDKMGGGEAAIAPYYAGDAITMIADNPDLAFAIPKEGTNYFVDAMCIPATSKKKEAAEMFINFMCEPTVALENCNYIGYSTPIPEVWEQLDNEIKYSPIAYPDAEILKNTESFSVLPDEINRAMDEQWANMKSHEEGGSGWIIIVFLAVAVVTVVLIFLKKNRRKKQDKYN